MRRQGQSKFKGIFSKEKRAFLGEKQRYPDYQCEHVREDNKLGFRKRAISAHHHLQKCYTPAMFADNKLRYFIDYRLKIIPIIFPTP